MALLITSTRASAATLPPLPIVLVCSAENCGWSLVWVRVAAGVGHTGDSASGPPEVRCRHAQIMHMLLSHLCCVHARPGGLANARGTVPILFWASRGGLPCRVLDKQLIGNGQDAQ